MMPPTQTLVLDTNCWIDYYVGMRPKSKAMAKLIGYSFANDIKLCYPACIIKDVFYLVALEIKRICREEKGSLSENDAAIANETAWSSINHMRENAFAVSVGQSDIWLAAKNKCINNDFEDNLVIAAAERVNGAKLVTSDLGLISHSTVASLTPEDALHYLKSQRSFNE